MTKRPYSFLCVNYAIVEKINHRENNKSEKYEMTESKLKRFRTPLVLLVLYILPVIILWRMKINIKVTLNLNAY